MSINISVSSDGKVKFSSGSDRVRLDDLDKWLGRNPDAILVKLEGHPIDFMNYRVGHICRIEDGDGDQEYNVFIGKHLIGQLPDEAIEFAKQIDYSPEFMISIVGKIEYGASAETDEIYIYVAE